MSSVTSDGANQDNSSSNSSPATENKKKRKAKESAPSDETRRNNHKLIEQRRRKKINDKLEDLRQILSALDSQNPNANVNPSPGSLQGNDHPNKSSILDNTIVAIQHLQQVATKLAIQHRQLQYESVHLRKVLAKASRPPASRPSQKSMIDGFNSPPNFDFASSASQRLSSNPVMPPPSALPTQLQEAQIRLAMYQHQQNQTQQQQQRYQRQDPRDQQSSFPPYLLNSSIPTPTSSSSSNSSSSSSSTESTPRSSVSSLADVAMQHKLWELLRRQQQEVQQQRANNVPSIDNLPINNNNTNAASNSSQGSPPF